MSLQFVGLSEINGPLVALDNVPQAGYEEMVELKLEDGSTRLGRIVQIEGSRAVIQVFEGTRGISLTNTKTQLLGHPMEIPLSPEILGREGQADRRPAESGGRLSRQAGDVQVAHPPQLPRQEMCIRDRAWTP